MDTGRPSSAAHRSAVRAFVRQHHPDVGGDPELFAAGLAELRARSDDRYDAPVVGVQRPRGIAQRWRDRRERKKRRRVR